MKKEPSPFISKIIKQYAGVILTVIGVVAAFILNSEVIYKFISEQAVSLGFASEPCLKMMRLSVDESSIYYLRDLSPADLSSYEKSYKMADAHFFKDTKKVIELKKKQTTSNNKNDIPLILILVKDTCQKNIVIKEISVEVLGMLLPVKPLYAYIVPREEKPLAPLGYQTLPTEMYEIKISREQQKYMPYKNEQRKPLVLHNDNYINFGIAIAEKDVNAIPLNALLKVRIVFDSDTNQLTTEPFLLRFTSL